MIINESERKGISKILNYLNPNDLNDLVLTITNRLIKKFEQDESIPIILNYSESSLDFLKKKKIKKELIFKYLNEEKYYAKTNLTKSELIKECLKYWGSNQVNESMDVDEDSESDLEEIIMVKEEENTTESFNELNHQVSINYSQNNNLYNDQQLNLTNQQFCNSNQSNNEIIQLAIKLTFEYNGQILSLNQMGNHQITEMLKNLMLCKLKFRPNLLPQFDGVKAELESHGLLKIIYNGILYLDEEPVGWFENLFGLISDSTLNEHNWRIKFLDAKLKLSKPIPYLDHYIQIYKQITN